MPRSLNTLNYTKLNGETTPSSGEKRLHELAQQLECEKKLNLDLAKKLGDQIVITNNELAFNTQEKLMPKKCFGVRGIKTC